MALARSLLNQRSVLPLDLERDAHDCLVLDYLVIRHDDVELDDLGSPDVLDGSCGFFDRVLYGAVKALGRLAQYVDVLENQPYRPSAAATDSETFAVFVTIGDKVAYLAS